MKIHVGNLSDEISEDDIRQAFEKSGEVESVTITKNKYNGQSKTFAFVVMKSNEDGQSAIDSLDGKELKGRTLKVGEALADEGHGGKGGPGGKGGFGDKKGHGGTKGGFGGSKGFNSGKGGFGGKKSFGGGRGGRGR
ncbi:MAG: RNA-binding protein [Planctomycetes bacterium]|nr:RNA-binding protein [Planctomycetota bacterium]